MYLSDTLLIAGAGMRAQSDRLRVVAENIANVDATGRTPDELPYRRKIVTFQNVMDKQLGVPTVRVSRGYDPSDFRMKYSPGHPAANEQGYILTANVESMVEMMDMREARRAYEANLSVVETGRAMLQRTLNIIQ